MIYTVYKGTRQLIPGTDDFHVEETEFTSEAAEVRFGIFHQGIYLGSLGLRKVLDKVQVYVPSVPESNLTRIGEQQFNLDFVEPKI